ncbi:MAG: Holliday junction resolvase RuvX [Candidatus Calescibacterium sp.]|nr:Holliday junction resolvase RuvX [Candidatus Calescibacterium sp.]
MAIANTDFKIIKPLKNIPNTKNSVNEIFNIIRDYSIDSVVIGLPVFPVSKQPNNLYPLIKEFSNRLKKLISQELKRKIEIYFVEEDYTTELAKIKFGVSKDIDKYSATVILQYYINYHLGGNYDNNT